MTTVLREDAIKLLKNQRQYCNQLEEKGVISSTEQKLDLQWNGLFKVPRENNFQSRILYSMKYPSKNKQN